MNWRAALIGAVVSGIALEALKWGFLHFAKEMLLESYAGVYGPLALVPMVLLWIYLSWLLILLGAEIAHAFQNLSLLEAEERRQHGQGADQRAWWRRSCWRRWPPTTSAAAGASTATSWPRTSACPPTWWAASSSG